MLGAAGPSDANVTIIGECFTTDSTVVYDGDPIETEFVSDTELSAVFPGTEASVGMMVSVVTGDYSSDELMFFWND